MSGEGSIDFLSGLSMSIVSQLVKRAIEKKRVRNVLFVFIYNFLKSFLYDI